MAWTKSIYTSPEGFYRAAPIGERYGLFKITEMGSGKEVGTIDATGHYVAYTITDVEGMTERKRIDFLHFVKALEEKVC